MKHQMYLDGSRVLLVEQTTQGRIERFAWVCATEQEDRTIRGQAGMYPMLPDVEPVTIDRETFEEAWGVG